VNGVTVMHIDTGSTVCPWSEVRHMVNVADALLLTLLTFCRCSCNRLLPLLLPLLFLRR
jgi:hypothetical protein